MGTRKMGRRDFLRKASAGAAVLLGGRLVQGSQVSGLLDLGDLNRASPAAVGAQTSAYVPDAEISLTAGEKVVRILPGAKTKVWGYTGQLVSGSGVSVQEVPGSYLGPIIRVQTGKKLRIVFHNNLPEDSVVHPHGLRVPEDCDGTPMQAIKSGQTKTYDFQVIDAAGPDWFHPHPMGRTAEQVILGMAGLFYITDAVEEAAIPGAGSGANDIPVIIQDRNFGSNNQLLYNPNMMWGYLGNRILVNGQVNQNFALEPRSYRMRLLNGSNARTYKLAWSNNMPINVIGTEGGLLPAVVTKPYLMLMPGERVDIWADFSTLAGNQVVLRSLQFTPGGMGMMGGMGMGGMGMGGMGGMGSGMANGAALDVLTVTVGQKANSNPQLGALPRLEVKYDASNVPNFNSPRTFTLSMQHMMTWTINGRVYEPMGLEADEIFNVDETVAWEWVNLSPIPHPMHIHNVHFQVVQRTPPTTSSTYQAISDGLVDSGWKDTVLVWPGERVKVAMKFGPHTGMYMYHCHILEHEDMTMMRNFKINGPATGNGTMPGM